MRVAVSLFLTGILASAQASPGNPAGAKTSSSSNSVEELKIPAGTKVPVALKHAISTRGTREGDAVYECSFPRARMCKDESATSSKPEGSKGGRKF
jgi:hypothetical protein